MRLRGRSDRFADRRTAGRLLAERLATRSADPAATSDAGSPDAARSNDAPGASPGWVDPLVLGLVRGGVPVARQIADALGAPLDVAVVRKIGAPGRPELGVGAITPDGLATFDRRSLNALGLTPDAMAATAARERAEAGRRLALYRAGRPPLIVAGRDVILVDDGLATGVTAQAAIRALRRERPRRIVLAAPVGAPSTVRELRAEADDVLCLREPADLVAISRWYVEFGQVDDAEVLDLLAGAGGQPPA